MSSGDYKLEGYRLRLTMNCLHEEQDEAEGVKIVRRECALEKEQLKIRSANYDQANYVISDEAFVAFKFDQVDLGLNTARRSLLILLNSDMAPMLTTGVVLETYLLHKLRCSKSIHLRTKVSLRCYYCLRGGLKVCPCRRSAFTLRQVVYVTDIARMFIGDLSICNALWSILTKNRTDDGPIESLLYWVTVEISRFSHQ